MCLNGEVKMKQDANFRKNLMMHFRGKMSASNAIFYRKYHHLKRVAEQDDNKEPARGGLTSQGIEKDKVTIWKLRGKCGLDRFSRLNSPEKVHKS